MGVDAEMFVRLKGCENWLKPEDERRAAYELASTFGSDHFLITIGDWPKETSWEHHALSIMMPIKDARAAEYHGADDTAIGRTIWMQDGDPIIADDDEQFIRVHIFTRYYGERYARGDWLTIKAVAEWCERRWPAGEVWYGGDSSGICAEHLTPERRQQIHEFFLTSGRKSYTHYGRTSRDSITGHAAPICPVCSVGLIGCGGGHSLTYWYSDGCGKKAITTRGITHWVNRHVEFFAASDAISRGVDPNISERPAAS